MTEKDNAMSSTATYWQAIEYAADAFNRFYDQHERVKKAYAEGREQTNFVKLMERDEGKLAAATSAQTEMICYLFGISEERVHGDLMSIRNQTKNA